MKRVLSLILALVLCLGLCACGEGQTADERYAKYDELLQYLENGDYAKAEEFIQNLYESSVNSTDSTAKDPEATEDPEKLERYEYALSLLNKKIHPEQGNEFKEAYEILTELGDYKDAQEYLSRFTIIPDVLLSWTGSTVNAFNETQVEETDYYLYDSKGRMIGYPGRDYYFNNGGVYNYYFYDEAGYLVETQLENHVEYDVIQYTNNHTGLPIEEKFLTSDGSTHSVKTNEYNDAGELVSVEWLFAYNYLVVGHYEYEDGLLVKQRFWTGDTEDYVEGNYNESYTYVYENGLLIQKKHSWHTTENYVYENGLLIRVEDDDGKILEANTYENGRIVSKQMDQRVTDYTYGDYYCYTPAE